MVFKNLIKKRRIRMKNTAKIGFLMILAVIALTACAGGNINIPLPQTINIEPAKSDVPLEIAAFLGKWEGWWPRGMDAVLIVEKIDKHGATIIYAWGEAPSWRIKQGYRRYDAAVYIEESIPSLVEIP